VHVQTFRQEYIREEIGWNTYAQMKDIVASTVLATDRDVRAQYADHRMREGQGRRQMPSSPSFTSLHSFQQTSGK
jgi:hypothetical protein